MSVIITELNVKDRLVGVMRVRNIDYISLTDIARAENSSEPSFTIKNWLRMRILIWSNSAKLNLNMEKILLQCLHHNGLKERVL